MLKIHNPLLNHLLKDSNLAITAKYLNCNTMCSFAVSVPLVSMRLKPLSCTQDCNLKKDLSVRLSDVNAALCQVIPLAKVRKELIQNAYHSF